MIAILFIVMLIVSIRVMAKHAKSEDNAAFKRDFAVVAIVWDVVWGIVIALMQFTEVEAWL